MAYIGTKPADKPLTAADITDSIITSAKIVDGTITNSDVASSIITGQTAETSIAGGDSILIYDDSATALRKMTRTNFVSGIGGTNTPNFWVYMNADQSVADSTFTTVQFNAELFDTANAFDTSTYTYTIPSAGKYFFGFSVRKQNVSSTRSVAQLCKNGSQLRDLETGAYSPYGTSIGTSIEDLAINDTITIKWYHTSGGSSTIRGSSAENSFFYGFKLIT
jgi:hypothetical protein